MSYGLAGYAGVINKVPDWTALTTGASIKITATMLTNYRTEADSLINAKLAEFIDVANIPLVTWPEIVNTISDLFVACYVFNFIFTQQTENDSEWAKIPCEKAEKLLEKLDDSKALFVDPLGNPLSTDLAASTTLNYDRVFELEHTQNDTVVQDGTMEDW